MPYDNQHILVAGRDVVVVAREVLTVVRVILHASHIRNPGAKVSSGLSLRHRYHAGIRLRTSEYFH